MKILDSVYTYIFRVINYLGDVCKGRHVNFIKHVLSIFKKCFTKQKILHLVDNCTSSTNSFSLFIYFLYLMVYAAIFSKGQHFFSSFSSRPPPGLLTVLGPLGSGKDATHQPSPALSLLGCW